MTMSDRYEVFFILGFMAACAVVVLVTRRHREFQCERDNPLGWGPYLLRTDIRARTENTGRRLGSGPELDPPAGSGPKRIRRF